MTDSQFAAAAALLRAAGWTVTPPTPEVPPIEVGQVWVSPRPWEDAKTVVRIGPHHWYPPAGDRVVFFTTPKLEAEQEAASPEVAFAAWASVSGARPAKK